MILNILVLKMIRRCDSCCTIYNATIFFFFLRSIINCICIGIYNRLKSFLVLLSFITSFVREICLHRLNRSCECIVRCKKLATTHPLCLNSCCMLWANSWHLAYRSVHLDDPGAPESIDQRCVICHCQWAKLSSLRSVLLPYMVSVPDRNSLSIP